MGDYFPAQQWEQQNPFLIANEHFIQLSRPQNPQSSVVAQFIYYGKKRSPNRFKLISFYTKLLQLLDSGFHDLKSFEVYILFSL